MPTQVQQILDLARLDTRIRDMSRTMSEKGIVVDLERKKLGRQRESTDVLRVELKRLQRENDRRDLDLKACGEKVLKLTLQQNTAKTNEEFSAFGREIKAAKDAASDVETLILEAMTRIDEVASAIRGEEQRLKDLDAHVARVVIEVEREMGEARAELIRLETERSGLRAAFSGDAVQHYERVLLRHGDSAVAAVLDGVCQGCYMSVTAQHVNLLMKGEEVVYCNACNRILYLEASA